MKQRKVQVGVVQQAVQGNHKETNWQASATQIRQLAADGAQLILLQELHSTLYFCQDEAVATFDLAEPLDGAGHAFFGALAAELNIVLVTSMFEKRAPGLFHNTAVVYDCSDEIAGVYRKMHIPDDPGFYEKFYFTPGDLGFTPIETSVGRLGVLVCWDQWYPEAARLMAMAGAELLLYPTAIGWDLSDDDDEQARQRDAWVTIQRAHAVANGVPVIVANRTGFEAAPKAQSATDGIAFWGTSFVTGPQGEILAEASTDEPANLLVEVDLGRSEDVRRIWPYFRDRRIDDYQDITKRWRN